MQQEHKRRIFDHFLSLGVTEQQLVSWWSIGDNQPRKERTLQKMIDNLPTAEEIRQWCELTGQNKSIKTLSKIKYPLLVGWSFQDIQEAMTPYVLKHIRKYHTARCDIDDCQQNAAIGIIKAIKTDAGIQPFAMHCYLHVRTNVRRPSATAGLIKRPERKPSRTDVRKVITDWATGRAYQLERDRMLRDRKNKLSRKAKRQQSQKIEQILDSNGCNRKKLIRKCDQERYFVQVIGSKVHEPGPYDRKLEGKRVTERHISERLPLSHFDAADLFRLFDYLDYKFSVQLGDPDNEVSVIRSSYISIYDTQKLQTVGDLIERVAESPDFHGNPQPLSAPTEDGLAMGDTLAHNKSPNPLEQVMRSDKLSRLRSFISSIRHVVDLSPGQELIFRHIYGLDGAKPLTGSEISARFGELLGEEPKIINGKPVYRNISRQRITQQINAIHAKVIDAAFSLLYQDPSGRRALEKAIRNSEISDTDRKVICHRYGLCGATKRDAKFIATNYVDITGKVLPKKLSGKEKEKLVNQTVQSLKATLVGAASL